MIIIINTCTFIALKIKNLNRENSYTCRKNHSKFYLSNKNIMFKLNYFSDNHCTYIS